MLSQLTLLTLVALLNARSASAAICYDRFRRQYYCNGGLSWGARLGIGLGIAAGVILLFSLCGYWRRKQLRNQFSKYRPPALPYTGPETGTTGANPYANNPPPPVTQGSYNNSSYASNPYGSNPAPPPQTYQPSMAGQYTGTGAGNHESAEHEHGYEWEQAREAERLAQQGGQGGVIENGPPGYDIATSTHNTGSTNNTHYTPPPGPPPGKAAR
ncbi:hypothetical protein CI109_100426 [Kwoniella shandongensis]|uniref:Uncharacterized protein n=1 Tax=Kwoniella shandongensis TaxID=1734106 RepID=A0A5M6C4V8_9TREE|nr:uncharacterized protein CI109_001730 [Kwoniella shandongensis]KAA5529790.1 hypothetical protein CI109_001730 [Kwoniella shandongensis]